MKVGFERHQRNVGLRRALVDAQANIILEATNLEKSLGREKRIQHARQFYAACVMQGLARGFITRNRLADQFERLRAARLIQRVIRGKFGRRRAQRKIWEKTAVVKNDIALRDLLERSSVIRETKNYAGVTLFKENRWKEMYDPLTDAIWYWNETIRRNTWECPYAFQKELVCHWEGIEDFGCLSNDGPCRQVFSDVIAYQNHLRLAHKWYCPACETRNSGLSYPRCHFCGNRRGFSGNDIENALTVSMDKVRRKLQLFLVKDGGEKNMNTYNIKKRLVEVAIEKKAKLEEERNQMMESEETDFSTLHPWELEQLKKQKSKNGKGNKGGAGEKGGRKSRKGGSQLISRKKIEIPRYDSEGNYITNYERYVINEGNQNESKDKTKASDTSSEQGAAASTEGFTDPAMDPNMRQKILEAKNAMMAKTLKPDPNMFLDYCFPCFETVTSAARKKESEENNFREKELEGFIDPLGKGIISPDLFESVVDTEGVPERQLLRMYVGNEIERRGGADDDDDDDDNDESDEEDDDEVDKFIADLEAGIATNKMLVCPRYLKGDCTLTTCPLAHPGFRDLARVHFVRSPSKAKKVAYVKLCQEHITNHQQGGCSKGIYCKQYHIYIRPPTAEIIRRIYPVEAGVKARELLSGLKYEGHTKNDKFNGFGILTWTTGSTYVGSFVDNMREGFGVLRGPQGNEYVGEWKDGMRHGFGMSYTMSGEEHVGYWQNGRMHGVGRLTTPTGDMYEGEFADNKYHGIGLFQKSNGDAYMGHIERNMAQGLGILRLFTGEKYKGYFDRNFRHGKGVCIYKNGARFAGEWYRGVHEGFGLFISPLGEKFVGMWGGGKKQGKGRYYFKNGDMYDGDFDKNKANGMGVYYHSSGSIYKGEWKEDHREGRGTYVYADGTTYTGLWAENIMAHKGKFDFYCGAHYRGEVKRGVKHGMGVYSWPNGNVYKGEFNEGVMEGHGDLTYFMGHRYVGQWKENKKNGTGTFYYSMGHMYEGEWCDDLRQGQGKMTWLPGTTAEESYDGQWENDLKHGYGVYKYRIADGSVYEGDWVRGFRHGQGKVTFKDGSFYRGSIKQEQMWGEGVMVFADGSQYDGAWRQNMRHGHGTLMTSDGSIYSGQFVSNKKHGKGKIMRADGTVYRGVWEDGLISGGGRMTIPLGRRRGRLNSEGEEVYQDGDDTGPTELTVKVLGY